MAVRTRTRYQSDSGTIHQILMTPEAFAAAGTPPTAAVDSDIRAKITKTNREYGIRPRFVTATRTLGTGDDAYTDYIRIPVLTPTAFASAAFQKDATLTYDGNTYTIATRSNEDY